MALFTWGLGKSGQLGTGKKETEELPVRISLPKAARVVGAGAGGLYTALVTADGRVFCTGSGVHGRLGDGGTGDAQKPQLVQALSGLKVVKVSCGIWHGAAVTDSGEVYMWGYDKAHGVLGVVDLSPRPHRPPLPLTPLSGHRVAGVTCGNNYTMAWTAEGDVFSWGSGRHGVLGHGDEADRPRPTRVPLAAGVVHADAGFAHAGLVSADGAAWMTGAGRHGALGHGEGRRAAALSPLRALAPPGVMFGQVSCSKGENHGHTLGVTRDTGEVYVWGDGYKGKLGLGDQTPRWTPARIPPEYFSGERVVGVSAGGIHSCAVSAGGRVYTWGCGSDGRLGHPEAHGHRYLYRADTPRLVEQLGRYGHAVDVKASYYHTVAIVDVLK